MRDVKHYTDEAVQYYYIRDFQKRPMVTVAIASDEDGIISRGIAVCSWKDHPVKSLGREIAWERLRNAFLSEKNSEPIETHWRLPDLFTTDDEYEEVFQFKSEYDVEASDFELGLLDRDFRKEYNGDTGRDNFWLASNRVL